VNITGSAQTHDEAGIQQVYSSEHVAQDYVRKRFDAELTRLLHDRQLAAVQSVIDRVAPVRILEIAPGPGRLTRDIRTHGLLVCLEFNEAMIAEGRCACNGAGAWVRGNGFQLAFDQAFDLVYSFRFIRHFHREDRDRLYAEIRRVLKPGGYLVLDAVNERVSRPLRAANPESYPIYDKLYRPEELREELAGAGLEPVEMRPIQKFYGLQARSQILLGPRANWLNRLIIRGLERMPGRNGLEWIVTCRRA